MFANMFENSLLINKLHWNINKLLVINFSSQVIIFLSLDIIFSSQVIIFSSQVVILILNARDFFLVGVPLKVPVSLNWLIESTACPIRSVIANSLSLPVPACPEENREWKSGEQSGMKQSVIEREFASASFLASQWRSRWYANRLPRSVSVSLQLARNDAPMKRHCEWSKAEWSNPLLKREAIRSFKTPLIPY